MLRWIGLVLRAVWGVVVAFGFMCFLALTVLLLSPRPASAHTGSPAMVTWSSGQYLTYTDLNNALAHIHNTLSAGIVDANLSSSAAIAHSKLQTPALVSKAVLSTTTACVGAGAAGTDCTVAVEHSKFLSTSGGAGAGNSALEATGNTGRYDLTLSYTPTDTNFVVNVAAGTLGVYCAVVTRATAAPHMRIHCRTDAAVDTDTNIMVSVFDTN